MKKAIKYGAISGLIMVGSWFFTFYVFGDTHFSGGEAFGYAVMLLALTSVFMGIKDRRDQQTDGAFTFKDGFLTGLGIVLVASVIYVIGWMIYMPNFVPDFVDKYEASQIELVQRSSDSEQEKQSQIQDIVAFNESYRKPHVMSFFVFLEIFPVGLLVTLLSALILRRKT